MELCTGSALEGGEGQRSKGELLLPEGRKAVKEGRGAQIPLEKGWLIIDSEGLR